MTAPRLSQIVTVATAAGWCCLLAAVYLVDAARPMGFKTDRFFGVGRRRIWDAEALDTAFWLIVAAVFVSVIALAIELNRSDGAGGASKASVGLAAVAMLSFVGHLLVFG